MASNILSKFLPPATGSPSIYETFREQDQSSDPSDVEERAGMALDEENLGTRFQDYELEDGLIDATANQRYSLPDTPKSKAKVRMVPKRSTPNRRLGLPSQRVAEAEAEDLDDEVPQSLLIEDGEDAASVHDGHRRAATPPFVPGSTTKASRAKWQAAQEQQRLHPENNLRPVAGGDTMRRGHVLGMIDPRERAMWRWANVENLDNFLKDVYDYFVGNGVWCILLSRLFYLLTLAFVVGFTTFLTSCIEFHKVPSSKHMNLILVPQCATNMSGFTNLLLWLFVFLWICKLFQYILDIARLKHMHDFYHYLLEIPDTDIQTVSWQEVVKRLMLLRDSNPSTAAGVSERHRRFMGSQSKQRMDAHDIANRLMRRDNYLIALINKDILDLTLPIPFLKKRQLFSKTLEWNLSLCILDYVFNEQGQVRPLFLKDTHRRALSDGLRRRFIFAGFMNVLCAPFIILYFIMLYFFRYFNEYQRNPSQIGSRQYTPLAEWKFREFNELWHLFRRRTNMSYPFASRYIDQFPKDKTVQLSRFVAFIAGALASVLALASVIDPELLLGFEITHERNVLFYLGVFGTIWAVARGAVPEENLVFDPEFALTNVIEYTHYLPSHWRGRLHSDEVRTEFALLYQMKVIIFLEEILSIIFTPFILWFSLPKCSDPLVDFFREFTLHVDGLGYVCSFAVFDFKKGSGNLVQQSRGKTQDLRDEYYSTKDGKMLASYYGFIDNYVTNPLPGAPFLHPSGKRNFYPPPSFPGMASPTIPAETNVTTPGMSDRGVSQHRRRSLSGLNGPGLGHPSSQRTPRFAVGAGQSSPITSILLDPQHQPAQSALRPSHRTGTQSRLRASRKPLVDLIDPLEDEEELLLETTHRFGAGGSGGGAEESNLGESWKTTRAGAPDDDGEEDEQAATHAKGQGVLGLVYQFSKAQTEGRGTAVNI